jgi:hypothetical protein
MKIQFKILTIALILITMPVLIIAQNCNNLSGDESEINIEAEKTAILETISTETEA